MQCDNLKKIAAFYGLRSVSCGICGRRLRFSRKKNDWIDAPRAKKKNGRRPVKVRPYSSRSRKGRAHTFARSCAR